MRINHEPDVPGPDNEISRLRAGNALKLRQSGKYRGGRCVRILESRARKEVMHQVRAVGTLIDRPMVLGELGQRFAFGSRERARTARLSSRFLSRKARSDGYQQSRAQRRFE